MAFGEIGKLFVSIGADLKDFQKGLTGAKKDLSEFGKWQQKHAKTFKVAGFMMAGAAAGMGAAGLKMAADFEGSMREVNTMMGLSQEEFENLSDQVLETAKDVGKAPEEMSKALYQVVSAGIPAGEAIEFLGVAAKAAIAGVTDAETAVDGITTVINAFGMQASEAQHVADVMFTTVKGGKTTFEELSASLFQVAPIAASAGVEFEEVAAALATMTKQGVPTKIATTQLRAAIQSILKPTEGMIEALAETADISGPVMDAYNDQKAGLGRLQDSLSATRSELDEVRYSYIATTDEMRKLTGEIDELGDKQTEIRLEIRKMKYAAEVEDRELTEAEIARIKSLELEMEGLGISMDELGIKQDDASEQAAAYNDEIKALEAVENERKVAVQEATSVLEEHQKELDALTASSGAAMLADKGLAATFNNLTKAAEGDTNQLIKMFGSIEAVQAIMALTEKNAETFAKDLEAIEEASDGAGAATEAYNEMNRGAARQFETSMAQARGLAITLGMALMPTIQAITKAINPLITLIADWIAKNPVLASGLLIAVGVLGSLLLVLGFLPTIIVGLTAAVSAFGVVMGIVLSPIGLMILAIAALIAIGLLMWKHWDEIAGFFKDVWERIKNFVIEGAQAVWDFLKEWGLLIMGIIFPPALIAGAIIKWKDEIVEKVGEIKDSIVDVFKGIWDTVVGAFSAAWSGFADLVKAPINAVIGMFNEMIGLLSGKVIFDIPKKKIGPVTVFPGWKLKLPTIPEIPTLEYGGIVPGPRGAPTLIVAHGGEEYLGVGGKPPTGEPSIGELHIHTLAFAGTRADAKKLWNMVREAARGDQRTMLGEAGW